MDIYDYLIDNGADPNLQDSFGNTTLHMVVIADQPVSERFHKLYKKMSQKWK
jgi:ankyrin repeat protein